ncbi:MAG: hypothetical protein WA081_18495 [Desulfosalsimonadaceae bacterium]
MTDIVAAIQSAIEIVGRLRALSRKVEDAEFKMLLADLSGDLADAKLEMANLKFELAEAKQRLQAAESKLQQRETLKPMLTDGAYSFDGDAGHYCTACFDTKGQKVRLTSLPPDFRDFGKWECPACKAILN